MIIRYALQIAFIDKLSKLPKNSNNSLAPNNQFMSQK